MSGVANMRAGITSLNRLRGTLRDLPLRIRAAVANDAAELLDAKVREEFSAGRTVYDEPRPRGKDGQALTLVKTGRVRSTLGFVAIGTIVRAQLGMRYARFLVGKYKVLPQRLPAAWSEQLEQLVREYREDFEREALR